MRGLFLAGVVGLLLSAPSVSSRPSDWYWGVEAGVELGDGALNGGADLGVALLGTMGAELGANFALEGEVGYRSTTEGGFFGDVDITQLSLMLNGIYEVPLSDTASLALGLGVGVNDVDAEFGFFSQSDTTFAAQVKLGLAFEVNEHMDLVTNVRYMTPVTSSNGISDIDNTTITIGLKFDL